jgi:hypothetical protein
MCSYKKEILADSADYNAVTVVMHNNNTDIAGAIQWISGRHDELVERFLKLRNEVYNKVNFPSYGDEMDRQLEAYVDGLGQYLSTAPGILMSNGMSLHRPVGPRQR